MRTTLNLDDEALAEAMEVAPGMTKTELVNRSLREFARHERLRGLLEWRGRGDLGGQGRPTRLRKRSE